jgi:hypothetical protein
MVNAGAPAEKNFRISREAQFDKGNSNCSVIKFAASVPRLLIFSNNGIPSGLSTWLNKNRLFIPLFALLIF